MNQKKDQTQLPTKRETGGAVAGSLCIYFLQALLRAGRVAIRLRPPQPTMWLPLRPDLLLGLEPLL